MDYPAVQARFYFCIVVVAIGLSSFIFVKSIWTVMIVTCSSACASRQRGLTVIRLCCTSFRLRFTEAVGIMGAMNSIGGSIGNSISGYFIDQYGAHGGFVTVAILAYCDGYCFRRRQTD